MEYAHEQGLKWIEDESNASTRFDRNYVRLELGPRLDERYPGWRDALARFARHAGTAGELLDDLATLDGVPIRPGEPLPLVEELSAERRANVLRAFLARNAVAMPSEVLLAEMSRQLFEARVDARVRIDHAGVAIVRHKDTVRIERELGPSIVPAGASQVWRVEWRRERDVELGGERGTIHFDSVRGDGIAAEPARSGHWYFAPRSGGETIRLGADRPTRTLKNLLQEREIPTWQREKLPLLFHEDRLVWVPGVGIAAEYACPAGQEGFSPSWRVAGKSPVC
jgi:tRNA(Ile)-lysidine synthase